MTEAVLEIAVTEFKAKCLALMNQVAATGETITITKNGKPIAELKPYRPPRPPSLIGLHAGRIEILGDLIEPIGKALWEAPGE